MPPLKGDILLAKAYDLFMFSNNWKRRRLNMLRR